MALMFKCSWVGCNKILELQGYCPIHKAKVDKDSKQRYKVYKTIRLMDAEQKKYNVFYNSRDWLRIRDSVIANCYGIDIVEYYRTSKIVQGFTVHHIQTLDSCWDLRLNIDNLIYLTESNHQFIHREMNKGDREEKAIKRILIELKSKFIEEFQS